VRTPLIFILPHHTQEFGRAHDGHEHEQTHDDERGVVQQPRQLLQHEGVYREGTRHAVLIPRFTAIAVQIKVPALGAQFHAKGSYPGKAEQQQHKCRYADHVEQRDECPARHRDAACAELSGSQPELA